MNLLHFLAQTAHAAASPNVVAPTLTPDSAQGFEPRISIGSGTSLYQAVSNFLSTGTFSNLFDAGTLLAGTLAIGYLIWSGIQYITAGGSPDKTKAARAGIVNAVIGIIIITAAYAIVRLGVTIGAAIQSAIGTSH